jgi:hypothetical protein
MMAIPNAWTALWQAQLNGPDGIFSSTGLFQRNAVAIMGALAGATITGLLFIGVWDAHDEANSSLAETQAKLAAQKPETAMPDALDPQAHGAGALWMRLPDSWPTQAPAALRQFLINQRLQVQTLRVLPGVVLGPLQGQSLAIRMTGRYADWVRAWQLLSASGPVLSIERMSVMSMTPSSGVQMDLVLHVWSGPGSTLEAPWPSVGLDAPVTSDVDFFASPGAPDGTPPAEKTKASEAIDPTDDPMAWPLDRVRWLGTWEQGHEKRAVLSAGGAWVTVRVGERVSREGHKVAAIGADGLVLKSPQGQRVEIKGGGR